MMLLDEKDPEFGEGGEEPFLGAWTDTERSSSNLFHNHHRRIRIEGVDMDSTTIRFWLGDASGLGLVPNRLLDPYHRIDYM